MPNLPPGVVATELPPGVVPTELPVGVGDELPPPAQQAHPVARDVPMREPSPSAIEAEFGINDFGRTRDASWINERIDAAARSAPTAPVVDGQPFGPIIPNYKTHEEQARSDALRAASPPGTLSEQLLNDYVKVVTRHPGLQVWTDQNIKHAAKLVPEADKLTSYEYLISGGWASTRDVYGRDTGGQFWIPPVWASAPLSAVLGIMSGMLAAMGESPDSAPGSAGADLRDLATEPVPGATTGPRKFVAGALSGATTVALAAPLGPGAAAGFFGLLGVGHLRDYMEPWVQAGTLPAWKRDLFAAAGGLGAGLIQSFGFGALMKGLQPLAPQAVQSAKNLGAGVLLDLLRRPSMVDVVGSWARSTAHGLVGLTTSALTDEITHALATGKKIDYENVYEAGRSALELGLVLGGVGAGREYLDRLGRWHEAQHDAATIAGVAGALKDSGFVKAHPDEAREVFGKMMGDQKYVFLDPNELAKLVPQHVADFIAGRDGALADAILAGTKIPVKVDRLLVDHADIAEAMAKHATMHADGSTAKEVGNKPPLVQDLFAELQKALGVEVKPSEEHKNLNLADTLKGIDDTLAQMRKLSGVKEEKPQPMLDKRYRSGNYRKEWAAAKADAVPLDQLNEVKRQHETSLRQAQRQVEDLTAKSASEQGKATAAAQKGVELGVEAAQVGRTAADVERANISSEQAWAAAKRRKLRKLGPTIDRLSATEMVQESSTRLQKKAEDQSVKATGKEISAAEKMKEAQRANNLRDNVKALTDALEKRRKEGLKLAEHVADMADDDVRASLYKSGQQYGTAYDKIMEAIGAREPDGRTPFDTDLRVLKGWNPDITFDPQEVQQILDRKAAFGDLNIKDAKIVHDALRNLREVAKNASDVYIAGERVKRDQMIGEMASALKARGLLPNKFTTGSPEKESKLKGVFGVSKEMQGRFALWEPFGEQGARINEEASRVHLEAARIHAQWDRQVTEAYSRLRATVTARKFLDTGDPYVGDPEKFPVPMMDLDRSDAAPLSLRSYPKELPLSSVWHMQLLAGSESGMDALAKAFRKSPAEIDAFLAKHINTRAQLEYLQQIWDANEAIGDLAAQAHERREGIGFEKVKKRPIKRGEMEFDGGYSGLRYEWDPERKTVIPGNLADAYDQTARDRSDSPHYFTIERVPNTSGRIPQLSWSSMEANHRAVIWDAAASDFARDLSRLIEDPAFRSVTAQYLGKNHLDQLKGWAQTEVVGSTPIISEGIGTSEALLRGATRLQGRGVFAFNLPVVASQLSHLQIAKSFLGLSEESMSVGVAKALDPSRWTETRALSSGVDFRAEHFFAGHREMFDQISGVATGPLMSQVDKAGRGLTFMMDRFLSNAIFEAQLHHYQKEGATFAGAIKKANAGLERVMPPLQMQDQSAFARNHRLLGMWVLVKNFPLAVGNMYAIDQWRAAAEQGAGRNALLTKLDHGATTLGIVGGLAMGALLAGRGRNQQEQDSGAAGLGVWMGRTLTEEAFYHNPIGSLVAREVAPMFWNHLLPSIDALGLAPGRREMGTSGIPALQLLDSLGRDAQDLISDEKPNDEKAFALLHGLGALTGFPPPAPLRGVKGAWRFLNGTLQHSTPDNALGFLGTAVYGDRATTNIPTELGGLVQ